MRVKHFKSLKIYILMYKYILLFSLLFIARNLSAQEKVEEADKITSEQLRDSVLTSLKKVLQEYPKKQQREFIKALLKQYPEEKQNKTPPDGWISKGQIKFLFNQSAFNAEWSSGGSNNIAGNILFNYDLNYKHKNWTWDNQLRLAYGLTKLEDTDFFRKTDDNFEYNSVLGINARKNWYYSAFTNLKTQLDVGYKYSKDGKTRTETSHGFSPAYVKLGLGSLWKKNNNQWINIAPIAGRMIFVHDHFTREKAVFGVEKGESSSLELGASIEGYFKFLMNKKLSVEQIISLYSNYFENTRNVDINYTLTLTMPITKYLNTSFIFQAIYDDDTAVGFQIREVLAIGINYNF